MGQNAETPSHSWCLKVVQSTYLFEGSSRDLLPPLLCLSPSPHRIPHHTPNSRRWTLVLVPLAPQPQGPHTEVPGEHMCRPFTWGSQGP